MSCLSPKLLLKRKKVRLESKDEEKSSPVKEIPDESPAQDIASKKSALQLKCSKVLVFLSPNSKRRGQLICSNDEMNCGLMGPCRHPVTSCKSPIRRKTFSGPDIAMNNKINIKGMTRYLYVLIYTFYVHPCINWCIH